eukprot:jgi/Chrzof1/12204/Cz06g25070.t1
MDPRAAEIAMEQMKRMSPEQMQQMMRSMPNMSPEMMQMAMSQMQNMSSDDWGRVKQQMNSMDPSAIAREAADAQNRLTAQQQYVLNGSKQLKTDGNKLHAEGLYAEAAEKYERAKNNLQGIAGQEAKDLLRACVLNLGSCYLNLGKYQQCVGECEAILAGDSQNLKALYRRGQALAALGRYPEAVADLEASVVLTNNDPPQQSLIKEKLEAAKQKLGDTRQRHEYNNSSVVIEEEEDGKIEDVTDEPSTQQHSSQQQQQAEAVATARPHEVGSSSSSTTGSAQQGLVGAGAGPSGSMDPEQFRAAAEMMRNNPDMLKQVGEYPAAAAAAAAAEGVWVASL